MSKNLYTLKKNGKTVELHLFKSKLDANEKCLLKESKSICQKMHANNGTKDFFSCKNKSLARILCARIGKKVCGTCISHLYSNY